MSVSSFPITHSHSGVVDAFSSPGPNVAGYASFSSENRIHAREGDQVVLNQSKFQATNEKGELISREESGGRPVRWTVNGKPVEDSKKIEALQQFYEEERLRQKNHRKDMKKWQQQFDEQMKQLQARMDAYNNALTDYFNNLDFDLLKRF